MESIWSYIKADLYRYNKLKGYKGLLRGLMIPGFRYMFFLRLASQHKNKKNLIRFFLKLILRKYVIKYGFQIPIHADIGEGFYIGHFGNIVMGSKVKIGKNCNISHNVTIGQTNRGRKKGSPEIGDKVWIGTGSVIVGNIKIGSNVLIAPLSYVNFDIPSNSIVVLNPIRIIPKENATEGYINNTIE